MTRDQHSEEARRFYEIAMDKLEEARTNEGGFSYNKFSEYKENIRQCNKHRGIARAMWTRSMNKKLGCKVF